MIEIFDSSCSRSLGQSASIRAAIDILNAPSAAGRPGMTPIGALFPNKNIPLSATTGSGICKEPAKSRFAIPCRITSAVKRSGICQQTIGCRRFVRNLRFSPAAERCTAEVCFHITDRNFRLYESGYVVTLSIAERGIYGISGRIRLAAPNIRVDMALYSGTAPTVETLTLKVARYTPACGCPDSGAACPVFRVCLRIPGRTVRSDTAGLRGHMSYRDYMDNP